MFEIGCIQFVHVYWLKRLESSLYRGYRDGGSPRKRPFHCISVGLSCDSPNDGWLGYASLTQWSSACTYADLVTVRRTLAYVSFTGNCFVVFRTSLLLNNTKCPDLLHGYNLADLRLCFRIWLKKWLNGIAFDFCAWGPKFESSTCYTFFSLKTPIQTKYQVLLTFWYLWARYISCSAKLSMKKCYNLEDCSNQADRWKFFLNYNYGASKPLVGWSDQFRKRCAISKHILRKSGVGGSAPPQTTWTVDAMSCSFPNKGTD